MALGQVLWPILCRQKTDTWPMKAFHGKALEPFLETLVGIGSELNSTWSWPRCGQHMPLPTPTTPRCSPNKAERLDVALMDGPPGFSAIKVPNTGPSTSTWAVGWAKCLPFGTYLALLSSLLAGAPRRHGPCHRALAFATLIVLAVALNA